MFLEIKEFIREEFLKVGMISAVVHKVKEKSRRIVFRGSQTVVRKPRWEKVLEELVIERRGKVRCAFDSNAFQHSVRITPVLLLGKLTACH